MYLTEGIYNITIHKKKMHKAIDRVQIKYQISEVQIKWYGKSFIEHGTQWWSIFKDSMAYLHSLFGRNRMGDSPVDIPADRRAPDHLKNIYGA